MTALRFAKYQGTGNDFIVIDSDGGPDARSISRDEAGSMCDRHFGIGADGILLAGVRGGTAFMRMLNPDGSEPEMCGNGLRCVVLHLLRRGHPLGDAFVVDTGAGPHPVRVLRRADRGAVIQVSMRPPSFAPHDVPVHASEPFVDGTIIVNGGQVRGTAVSIGNPHFVTFGDFDYVARQAVGPSLVRQPLFPQQVNVGFARPDPDGSAPQSFRLDVCERGAGWTLACGTGAVAAAAAAVEEGRARRGEAIEIRQGGGVVSVVIGAPGERALMTGPAGHVFDGEWPR